FFTAASLMIVVPTAVQFYCWLATMWHGRLQLKLPMLWVFGFFFVFLIGGLSGVMLASVPVDWQVHDTFFVVAHFHYVLIGGALFPMFGGLYFWIPKITGRMMNDFLGKLHFWLFFHRLQRHIFYNAFPWSTRHAATGLHLHARNALGRAEHACE